MRPTIFTATLSLILLAGTARSEDLIGVPDAASDAKPAAGKHAPGQPGQAGKPHDAADVQERMAKMKEKNPELFKKMDKDGDGKISPEEMKQFREERMAEMKEKNPELFKKLDKDGDGKISPEEMREGRELLEKNKGKGRDKGKGAE